MTTAHNIDLPTVLAERLTTTHPDVLRELLSTFIHTLMGADEGDPFGGPVAMRFGVGGSWSTVERTRLGSVRRGRSGACWRCSRPASLR
jgi:hypothetical protein